MPAPHSSRGAVRTKLCAFFESKKTPKTGRARQAKAKGQTKTEKAVQLTGRARQKPKPKAKPKPKRPYSSRRHGESAPKKNQKKTKPQAHGEIRTPVDRFRVCSDSRYTTRARHATVARCTVLVNSGLQTSTTQVHRTPLFTRLHHQQCSISV